jgi:hypothetical protein
LGDVTVLVAGYESLVAHDLLEPASLGFDIADFVEHVVGMDCR